MADVKSIAKARAIGLAIQQVTGVEPSYEHAADHVRIYFQPDRLKAAQSKLREWSKSSPGDIRVDWFPVITPMAIEKGLPIAAGLLLAGYLLGRL